MRAALAEAADAGAAGEVPVGCVFVLGDEVLAGGGNRTTAELNGTRHAELVAMDKILAAGHAPAILARCDLFVTVEPCIMCAAALSLVRVRAVYFGCHNEKFGGCGSIMRLHDSSSCVGGAPALASRSHSASYPATAGILRTEAIDLLRAFYSQANPKAPQPRPRRPPLYTSIPYT